ncbi:MAG: type I restriction enzyme HsdR N-terminal domain-containing protein [Prevotella sp.]|nr:type I restriction enzyme HsdR N-terminal domain-containing protein [Prevotella sp.]
MKKILKTNWQRYLDSTAGKEAVRLFNHLTDDDCSAEDMWNVVKRYNPELAKNVSVNEEKKYVEGIAYYNEIIKDNVPTTEEEQKDFDSGDFFLWLTRGLVSLDEETDIFDAPQIGFKNILGSNLLLSIALSANLPYYFLPNLYEMQFAYFKKFAEKYELDIPEMPHRSDYRNRWFYYISMINALDVFAVENELLDFGELCAFLFDYELTNIKEEMAIEHEKPMPNIPEQAWILVGNYSEGEKKMKEGVWQSNQLTRKGDIMVFYEKSPVKKMNAVWTALEDGFIEPFGPYYSYSIIGKKIEIPDDKALTYKEFKESDYFKNREKEGNFVSKNFQDVSGWAVTFEDYAVIKSMLEAKGFDTSVLPSLYEPLRLTDKPITLEKDVEDYLIKPLLEEMGLKENVDYKQQVPFHAGRGSTKRPDFCLHKTGKDWEDGAKIVIEVKLEMKTIPEIEENYEQGVTYARFGEAETLVICDKNQIRVYHRNKKGKFAGYDRDYKQFYWSDKKKWYNELKSLLIK